MKLEQSSECANCVEPITEGEYVSGEIWCSLCVEQRSEKCCICADRIDRRRIFEIVRDVDTYFVCEDDLLVFCLDRRFDRVIGVLRNLVKS